MAPKEARRLDYERGGFDEASGQHFLFSSHNLDSATHLSLHRCWIANMRRLTRSRAKADMQMSGSDNDMDVVEEDPIQDDVDEPQITVEDEDEDEEEDEDEDGKEDQLDDDEEDEGSDDEVAEVGPSSVPPRLRIKLKLPAQGSGASSRNATGTSTPEVTSRRRYARRVVGSDIESESSDPEDSDESASVATPGRPLTARQAVLRNVVDSSHVSLEEPPNPRKKKPLTEIEMALKREETARKRKNLSEKKLEDEKAETINRLLKKQSRPRGRRNALATAEDRPTPIALDADGEEVAEEGSATPILPKMYRWISTTKGPGAEPKMVMSFSVPAAALPRDALSESASGIDIDSKTVLPMQDSPRPPQSCDVEGCRATRKYRLVKDFHRGACGMSHLKQLEAQLAAV
ncbi:hypothetical protein BDY19DRAFT_38751 [Irpex rosettiformis]|uniref:Uncharacterized protein n=1 Tax=Irpex rosettiformis TaxID=378272 RepID=A0ACB8UKB8_9APHY|nr:hypothetical protein BDY19DRAFT_38751 [Irpex rosettiformis]